MDIRLEKTKMRVSGKQDFVIVNIRETELRQVRKSPYFGSLFVSESNSVRGYGQSYQ